MNRAFRARSRMLVRTCLAVLGVVGLVSCETEPQLVPDLPDNSQVDAIPLTDGSAVATTENGRATFQTSFYREPVTVVPINRYGSTVDEPLDVYFAEGDEGEVAVWVVDAGTDPEYTPYYFRGKLDELGGADAALDSQLLCGGLCLGAAVIGIGTTMVTGVLAGAKHDIEAVSEIEDVQSTGHGTWYQYCKTIPEITSMVDGIHTMERLPADVATETVISALSAYLQSVRGAAAAAKYETMIRTTQGAIDARDVVTTTTGAIDAAEVSLSLMNAVNEDYGTEVEWDVRVFVSDNEGKFGWRNREFHIYGPCEAQAADRWKADLRVLGPAPDEDSLEFQVEMVWDDDLASSRRPLLQVAYLDASGGFLQNRQFLADTTEAGRAVFTVPTHGSHQLVASAHVGVTQDRDVTGQLAITIGERTRDRPNVTSVTIAPDQPAVDELVTVDFEIDAEVGRTVVCEVDFGDGYVDRIESCGTGSSSHAYTARATQTIRLSAYYVEAPDDAVIVESSVEVSDTRSHVLDTCDVWTAFVGGGGAGLTSDDWDVSFLSLNTLIDIEFDAYSVPDRFQLRYDDRFVLWDSGWRGSGEGPSTEIVLGATALDAWDDIQVYVDGSSPDTSWQYRLRCRTP